MGFRVFVATPRPDACKLSEPDSRRHPKRKQRPERFWTDIKKPPAFFWALNRNPTTLGIQNEGFLNQDLTLGVDMVCNFPFCQGVLKE